MASAELVFFDGHCGLCHATVRFVLRRDADGRRFRFAPLQGSTVRDKISDEKRAALPDSVVVLTQDAQVLTRSAAVIHLLSRLPPPWPRLAALLSVIPAPVRDAGYRAVASVRRAVWPAPGSLCPLVPEPLRDRFLP